MEIGLNVRKFLKTTKTVWRRRGDGGWGAVEKGIKGINGYGKNKKKLGKIKEGGGRGKHVGL